MKEMFFVAWICLMILVICIESCFYLAEFIDWLVNRKYNKIKHKIIK